MFKDCSEEFKLLKPKIERYWFLVVASTFITFFLILEFFEKCIWGIEVQYILGFIYFLINIYLLRFEQPRCPNCDFGIYSLIEVKKYPIFLTSMSPGACAKCNAIFKK